MTISLSAFLLASHRRDVTQKHVEEEIKRLIRRWELNPHVLKRDALIQLNHSRVFLFSLFQKIISAFLKYVTTCS